MQQHSKAYRRIMKRRERRRIRERRRRILICAIAAGLITTAVVAEISKNKASASVSDELPIIVSKEPQPVRETQPETEVHKRWTDDEAYLLAKIAMAEAESEDTECKALVILTVLNRVESDSFPDTIKEVIYQHDQFTPVLNGRFDWVEPDEDCYAALRLVESGWDESQGALYFETADYEVWHDRNLKKLFDHGVTTFYTEYTEVVE